MKTKFRSGTVLGVVGGVLLAGLLAACDWEEGGYPRVVDRTKGTPPAAEFPTPAPPSPGAVATAPATDLAGVDLPEGVTSEMVDAGQQVYGSVCVACHGPGGAGTTIGPALDDEDWIHIDGSYESLIEITRAGVPSPAQFPAAMPPMGGASLDDDELRSVAAYVYVLSQSP